LRLNPQQFLHRSGRPLSLSQSGEACGKTSPCTCKPRIVTQRFFSPGLGLVEAAFIEMSEAQTRRDQSPSWVSRAEWVSTAIQLDRFARHLLWRGKKICAAGH